MITPGTVLAGKYRVERVLGEGGMGIVLAAIHVALDERVAIKLLRGGALDRPDVVERFLREGKNAVKLRSQHVARVLDVGTLENGAPYLVLEYLEGVDVDQMIRRDGAVPFVRAVGLILQACEAVAEAHGRGIVHRDIKPHNLFVTTGIGGADLLKVLDFGIAKSSSLQGGVLTRTDTSVGSPLYMSPEQMRSPKDIDARTDIWSLGVTLYEMISGRPPFNADTFPELVLRVTEGIHSPLASLRPEIPPALSEVVSRCLTCDREQRIQNVADLATALEPFAGPSARVYAENARRALGHIDSARALMSRVPSTNVPVAPPDASGAGTLIEPTPVEPTAAASNDAGPLPKRPLTGTGASGPNAWSGSASEAAVVKPRRTAPLLVAGLILVSAGAIGGMLALRERTVVAPVAAASSSASNGASSVATSPPPSVTTPSSATAIDAKDASVDRASSTRKPERLSVTPTVTTAPSSSAATTRRTERPTASAATASAPAVSPPADGIPRTRE